jgi:putative flippase GtrA
MAFLEKIDKAAAAKGKGVETFWQFVKFIVVSLGAFVIQLGLPYIIKLFMSDEFLARPYEFLIFSSEKAASAGMDTTGLGLFIALTGSNILAQIFSFFVNREKTFNSCANIKVVFPIYFVVTIALISFSAWLQPFLVNFLTLKGLGEGAIAISGAICACIQFFLYFPIQMILFRKKKEEKAE